MEYRQLVNKSRKELNSRKDEICLANLKGEGNADLQRELNQIVQILKQRQHTVEA